MKPWINPMERTARWFWSVQVISAAVATCGLFVILLLEPTPARICGAAAVAVIGVLLVWGARRGMKEAAREYRMEDS